MIICAECKREMRCTLNGVRCRWKGSHVYPGDLYECPECGHQTINTGNCNAYHNDNFTNELEDYYMDDFYEENVKKSKNLNLRRKIHA